MIPPLLYSQVETPLGVLHIVARDDTLCGVSFEVSRALESVPTKAVSAPGVASHECRTSLRSAEHGSDATQR